MRAAQREDFQREEGPTRGARGKEGSNKRPLPEIRGCQRGRGCDMVEEGLLHPHMVTAPQLDGCPKQQVPSGHLGTLRPREARTQGHMASQRPRWGKTCDFRRLA